MSEIKGCMNCGNISCGNNKKRESAGCGRWKDPEETEKEYKQYEAVISAAQKNFKELEEDYNSKDELFKKIAELEKENAELKESVKNWLKYEKETQYHKSIIKDLKKENAELKEKIRLMNEQEARDIRTRFPC